MNSEPGGEKKNKENLYRIFSISGYVILEFVIILMGLTEKKLNLELNDLKDRVYLCSSDLHPATGFQHDRGEGA